MLDLSLSYPRLMMEERSHIFLVAEAGEGVVARRWFGMLILARS
jgi:hypothetical protein